jgi:epoxyqueuosine reductase
MGRNALQQAHAQCGVRGERHLAGGVGSRLDVYVEVCRGQHGGGFFGPLGQLQAGAGKDVAKARVFPFLRVIETVEVKVPDVEVRQLVGLHHGIRGAFDTALHTQCMQQVAHQCGLAGAQVAMQGDEGQTYARLCRQAAGKHLGGQFVGPLLAANGAVHRHGGGGFYNGEVTINSTQFDGNQLVSQIQAWARELGFSQIGVADVDLSSAEPGLLAWLARGYHGDMAYMANHGLKRARPAELVPGTLSVITARMDYLPAATPTDWQGEELARLERPQEGIVSLYARGRDYHKVLRSRLQKLTDRVAAHIGPLGHRVFTDSAPVLEAELAARSGQGWRGKHTLLLNREAGSMFFLGEIYVDIALPVSSPVQEHCGTCNACISICPTQAIVAPHRLDARRCISYLTIEHAGPIPLELRPLMGNRIYGCDDCQLVCPWNKFAQRSALADFDPREGLSGQQLGALLAWTEEEFLRRTEGSPIRRIGHARWLRNVAVALGNALRLLGSDAHQRESLLASLHTRLQHPDVVVREHVQWAIDQTPGLK